MQINLRSIRLMITLLSLMLVSSVSYAQEYYKWVDEDGVTHYGEALPDNNTDHVAFKFPEEYATSNAKDDYYSIQNQLQRMLERRQLQREARRSEPASLPPQSQPVRYEEPRYVVGPLHRPIFFPHLKKKHDGGCKYGHDCYSPAPVHRKAFFHNRKSRTPVTRGNAVKKRGIHSGLVARTR